MNSSSARQSSRRRTIRLIRANGKVRFFKPLAAPRPQALSYMPGLDGLRGLAVLAVAAYHLSLPWTPGGLLGVCLFFVLSGYLITNILLAQWEQAGSLDLKDFWLRRARRLLPALFAMLAGVLGWIAITAPARLASVGEDVLAALFYTSNWRLIFRQVSYFESFGPPSPLGHLWSLAVEEQFYLVWPLILWLGLRYIRRRGCLIGLTAVLASTSALAMGLIYMPGLDPSRVYYGTDTRAFALLIGAVLALVWPRHKLSAALSGHRRLALEAAGGAALAIVLLMIGKTNEYQPFLYRGGLLFFSLAAAILIAVLAHPASRLGRFFGRGPLRWLGVCSYGIYLWHYPVIVLTSPAVNTGGPDFGRALGQIAASIFLAALSWFCLEKPIRCGKWKNSLPRMPYPHYWRKPLAISGRVTLVGVLLVFGLLCFAVSGSASIISQTQHQSLMIPASSGQEASSAVAGSKATAESQEATKESDPVEKENKVTEKSNEIEASEITGESSTADAGNVPGKGITAIGDSVMVDIEPELKKRLPGIMVDGQIGRQMYQASDVVAQLKAQGRLGKTVIIELGTNGPFTAEQLTDTLDALAGAEQIVLVNTRVPKPWEQVVNQTLAQVAETYPHTKLVDWYAASSGHNDYFYKDGIHLTPKGAEVYAGLLIQAVIR